MISRFRSIQQLLEEIDKTLFGRVSIHILGGAALLYRLLKDTTKDIDVVVETREEFQELESALGKLGFKTVKPSIEYRNLDLCCIFRRRDVQIDLFEKVVCSKFQLSKAMIERSERILGLEKIFVSICSNEDIFLFKTMTEREGDIEDCLALSRKGLDWEVILKEVKNQIEISGNDVWITWVRERLEILAERGVEIPIIEKIRKLARDFYKKLENKK